MERLLGDSEPLTVDSPVRLQVQAEFLGFLAAKLSSVVPSYSSNDYLTFLIQTVGKDYADWFQSFSERPGITAGFFRETFITQPSILLAQLYPDLSQDEYFEKIAASFRENLKPVETHRFITYDEIQQVLTGKEAAKEMETIES